MPSHDYWETACKNAEFKYWEPEYPSPELSAPAASWFFRKNARVLDAGTGGGNDAVFPALCGLKVTAIDWSHAALQIAEQRALKAGVKVGFKSAVYSTFPFRKLLSIMSSTGGCSTCSKTPSADLRLGIVPRAETSGQSLDKGSGRRGRERAVQPGHRGCNRPFLSHTEIRKGTNCSEPFILRGRGDGRAHRRPAKAESPSLI